MTDLLISGLKRELADFERAQLRLAEFEADPVITKADFDYVKACFNGVFEEAWKTLIKQPYVYDRTKTLTDAERELEWSTAWPAIHVVAGYQKRALKVKTPGSAMRDAMVALLAEMVPIAERVQALKPKIGKRPPKVTKTSIERDERMAKAMTCQVCARGILAETGQIAHHGYERPGDGYQTASCFGARELPFEVSREVLGPYIEAQQSHLISCLFNQERVQKELLPLTWTFSDYTIPRGRWERAKESTVTVTRETFNAIAVETAERRKNPDSDRLKTPSFDDLKDARLNAIAFDIRNTRAEIERQQRRFDGWKQTHQRQGEAWVALEVAQ